MSPKPKRKQQQPKNVLTLKQAIEYIDKSELADNTKEVYRRNITDLVFFAHGGFNSNDEITHAMTNKELQAHYDDENIAPLLTDFDKTVDIIQNKRVNRKTPGKPLSINTTKGYYLAIIHLARKGGCLNLPADTLKKYEDKHNTQKASSKAARDKSALRPFNIKYPDVNWDWLQRAFSEWLKKTPFTNTTTGRSSLRTACLMGLYMEIIPRRVQDYYTLQYYSKLPSEQEMKGRNILLLNRDTARLYLDDFKTRLLARKRGTKERKEVLPTFVKDLPPVLASRFRDYVSKAELVDNAGKPKPKKPTYIFHIENAEQSDLYAEKGFSAQVSKAIKRVFKLEGTVNDIRHEWQNWIGSNLQVFTQEDLQQMAYEFGDKSRDTSLGYRTIKNIAPTKTEKVALVREYGEAVQMAIRDAEEGGSVDGGDGGGVEKGDEMVSPIARAEVVGDDIYAEFGRVFGRLLERALLNVMGK